MEFYHGTVTSKEDIEDYIKKGDHGIITAYLPEGETFAVFFGEGKWFTFHENEEWFLNHFEVIQETK